MDIEQIDFPTQANQVTGHHRKMARGSEQFGKDYNRPGKLTCLRPFQLGVQTPYYEIHAADRAQLLLSSW